MTADAGGARAVIGRIAGTFGLRGEVKVTSADPSDLHPGLACVATHGRRGVERALRIAAVRPHQDRLVVRFEGIGDATAAQALTGAELTAFVADLPPLPVGTYRDDDLVGMRVRDARLGDLGEVTSVAHYPHADMLVVGERGLLVPLLAAYGVAIDAGARRIATSLPDGYEDL